MSTSSGSAWSAVEDTVGAEAAGAGVGASVAVVVAVEGSGSVYSG